MAISFVSLAGGNIEPDCAEIKRPLAKLTRMDKLFVLREAP